MFSSRWFVKCGIAKINIAVRVSCDCLCVYCSVALLHPAGKPRRGDSAVTWTTLAYIQFVWYARNSAWTRHHWKGNCNRIHSTVIIVSSCLA